MAVNFDVWGDLVQGEIEWFKKGQMECRLAKWFLVSKARDWRKLSFACNDILKIIFSMPMLWVIDSPAWKEDSMIKMLCLSKY